MKITVASLDKVAHVVASSAPTHMLTVIDPATPVDPPSAFAAPGRYHRIDVHDIDGPSGALTHPGERHTHDLIAFLRRWNGEGHLLVHCWMGVSRSSAAAYVALCLHNEGRESEAASYLRRKGAHAQPNRLIVSHADAILGRQGRMVRAVDSLGRSSLATMGTPYDLSLDLR